MMAQHPAAPGAGDGPVAVLVRLCVAAAGRLPGVPCGAMPPPLPAPVLALSVGAGARGCPARAARPAEPRGW